MKQKATSIVLAGAAPDTGNHGVSALCLSAVIGLAERGIEQFTLFDNGSDNCSSLDFEGLPSATVSRLRFQGGRRIYKQSNMHNVRLRQMLGLPSPALDAIKDADAVLDVSGGDSFTDLYGPERFDQIIKPKLMALDAGKPLILLPQTYGPFRFAKHRAVARDIIARSALAFARDGDSYAYMKQLLGEDFDPARHRLGVDLAFGLPLEEPIEACSNFAGINVSGLLWNDAALATEKFGLACDYKSVLLQLCGHIFNETDLNIRLVPHVRPDNTGENDLVACRALKQALPTSLKHRVFIEEMANTPTQLKGVIAESDWFTGARMHATIAALSTCTPVANMAYSKKARGVFDRCGSADQVLDMRSLTTTEMVTGMIDSFEKRTKQQGILQSQIPFVKRAWAFQMDVISAAVKSKVEFMERAYA
jgi:colanic acid/amylovoran biosynthesis protein